MQIDARIDNPVLIPYTTPNYAITLYEDHGLLAQTETIRADLRQGRTLVQIDDVPFDAETKIVSVPLTKEESGAFDHRKGKLKMQLCGLANDGELIWKTSAKYLRVDESLAGEEEETEYIYRGLVYTQIYNSNVDLTGITSLNMMYKQNNETVLNLTLDDVVINGTTIAVEMSENDTAAFTPNAWVYLTIVAVQADGSTITSNTVAAYVVDVG